MRKRKSDSVLFTTKNQKSCAILGNPHGILGSPHKETQEKNGQRKDIFCAAAPFRLFFTLAVSLTLLSACATPTQKLLQQNPWQQEFLEINPFQLLMIRNQKNVADRLHIYLSGDGHPWLTRNLIAKDPTPNNPITLQLRAHDTNAALYLGRPCYHLSPGKTLQPPCEPSLWTFERYSEVIVQIMTQGVTSVLGDSPTKLTLIGFSGGGVLATLIGERLPQVDTVITIAANLDTELWAQTMGYSPLQGSINPNTLPSLRNDIERIHLVAGKDQQVPLPVIDAFINKHGGSRHLFADFDHHCCWQTIWRNILDETVAKQNE